MGDNADLLRALAAARRTEQFLLFCTNPNVWSDRATAHLRAADLLYDAAFAAHERNYARLLDEASKTRHGASSRTLAGQELDDFHDERLLSEYLLLCGYGLECLFKGYVLSLLPELVVGDRRLDKVVKVHDLEQLAHDCAVQVTADEKSLLRLLTRCVVWGKYTVPLRVEDMPSWIDPDVFDTNSLAVANPFHQRRIQILVNGLVKKAVARLNEERQRRGLGS